MALAAQLLRPRWVEAIFFFVLLCFFFPRIDSGALGKVGREIERTDGAVLIFKRSDITGVGSTRDTH